LPARQQRIRRQGAGRKALAEVDGTLWTDLEGLLDPVTRGDPESPLRWTAKSTQALAVELRARGHKVSARTVAKLPHDHKYSLQSTRKTIEGRQHPDRNAQFEHINRQTKACHAAGQPVISVDTKKKELVGEFANKGHESQPAGEPAKVLVHDFPSDAVGKAIPSGVYDIGRNEGWVNVGVDHDTAAFAVASSRSWWSTMGKRAYDSARNLYILADAGGSNAYATGSGRPSCKNLPTTRVCSSASVICRPEPASGTKSSTGSSLTSHRTGAVAPSLTTRRW
jgi:Rhodopirellula transposase DDE domain